ncbi:MAG: translation elongation factor Ts [Halarsenatibacteraceae bacterium]
MAFGMSEIKELRERTGAGVLDCKNALTENDGNIEDAVDYLREKGMAAAAKRAGKVAAEGMVNTVISGDGNEGIIVEINSETDFVARNDNFKELVAKISQHLLESDAEDVDEALGEFWFEDDDKTLEVIIKEATANIGEKIELRRFSRFNTDGMLHSYIHMGGKIGVMVELSGDADTETANNIAMQIAASSPEYISPEEVTEEDIAREKKVYREQMINEGKPEHIIDNIVEGKINKFYNQVCLNNQEYIRDTDISVEEYLDEKGVKVEDFVRYEVGEGIEKEEEDFAAEVQAELNKN